MRIRTAVVWGTVGHSAVACLACLALIALTTVMHRRVDDLSRSMDAFRKASTLESELLLHRLTRDPLARSEQASSLKELVEDIDRQDTHAERRLARDLRQEVGRYLDTEAQEASGLFASSVYSTHRLAIEYLAAANRARERAASTDLIANALGLMMAMILAVTLTVLLFWLWHSAFRPFFALQSTMQRFAAGDANARVPEAGPEEFRTMAHTFNATASGLQRARLDQLRYTGAVLHDLRTPLSAIQLATQFVTNDGPAPSEARIRELFTLIRRQVTRINGIVGDSLGVLRAQAGDLSLRLDTVDACRLARESVDHFRSATAHHRIELSVPAEPIFARCDVARVSQLLNNLLSNAVKYSAPGTSIHVAVHEAEPHSVEFRVTDHGRGIAPEDQERIFEPFQRAVSAHEEIPGVGLGLYVSRCVAKAHGGKLEVESVLGEGATFRAILPVVPSVEERSSDG